MQLPSPDSRPKISARARLQTDPITGKPVLLYPEGALLLNPTGHAIILLCNGRMTFPEIVAGLAARYQISAPQIESEVANYLNRLRGLNLLELPEEIK
ncbi:MAG: pyrroloquinoline quinone biosynthesis peptide chaperone PqqD [Limisphaerales bacterium]